MVQPGDRVRHDGVAAAGGDELDRHRVVGLHGRGRLAREVVELDRGGIGERMLLGEHGDRDLLPERDDVHARVVDRQSHECEVCLAGRHLGELRGLRDAHRLERGVGPALGPAAQPLRGTHARDVPQPQHHPGAPVPPPDGGSEQGIGYGVRVSESKSMKPQTMKAETAAKKLGILLEAAPEEFRSGVVTRDELNSLLADPPEWLQVLRREGPHPRPVVAAKLGISNSGLARGGVTEPLTTAEIKALLVAPPAWLVTERATQAAVRAEKARVADRDRERAARGPRESGGGGGGSGV